MNGGFWAENVGDPASLLDQNDTRSKNPRIRNARRFTQAHALFRKKWCNDAGLEELSVHGLRKTASAVLAQNGCTEQEIMAITGHSTSKEVIRYTKSANQRVRAANAMKKVSRSNNEDRDQG